MSNKTYRVAFVVTHPIQYQAPLFAFLTSKYNIEITALYLSDFSIRGAHDSGFNQAVEWDIELLEGYEYQFMGEAASKRRIGGFFSMIAPELWGTIRTGNFDAVIVHGHNLAAHHVAVAACKSCGTPVFARAETHLRLSRSWIKNAIRTTVLKLWYRLFDGFLAIGTANTDYYKSMGVPSEKTWLVPYVVDNQRFISRSKETRLRREEIRKNLGLSPEATVILYASKFDRRKRADDLLNAFESLHKDYPHAQLMLVGSGEIEEELRNRIAERSIPRVIMTGFINQSSLPDYYAASDVFVLPADNEPWGLVVNEAMCAGLPIVLSQEIGCADDLVEEDVNGKTFEAGNVQELAGSLRPFFESRDLCEQYGEASINRISQWSFDECGQGLLTALESLGSQSKGT